MAMQLARSIQAEIRKIDGNMQCVDCSAKFPQWASVSYGTLFCLECSGQHRSLGVHLSFVRSIQMDSWTDKQIKTLRVGGNKNMKAFFEKYQVPETLSIKEKYNTAQAEAYRERIVALRDGKPPPCTTVPIYKPPPPRADGLSEEEAARQRMRERCGLQRGMNSSGSSRQPKNAGPDWNKLRAGFSSAWSSAAATTGKWSKGIREKTDQWGKDIKSKMDDAKLNEKLKMKSIKVEDATATLKSGWSWFTKGATDVWSKASDGMKNLSKQDGEPLKLYRTAQEIRQESGAPKLYRDDADTATTAPASRPKTSAASSNKSKAKASANSQRAKVSASDEAWGDDWGDQSWGAAAAPAKAPATTDGAKAPATTDGAWEKMLDLGKDEDLVIDDDDDDLLANFKDIDVGSTSTTNTKAVNQKDASATEGGEGWGNESLDIDDDDDGVFNSGNLTNIDLATTDKPPAPASAAVTEPKTSEDFFADFGV